VVNFRIVITSLLLLAMLPACTTTTSTKVGSVPIKPIPEQQDRTTINQLGKSDFDRMADVEMRENTDSLRLLMRKLYKRNPQELHKSTSDPAEKMVDWVFDGAAQHQFQFEAINKLQDTDAIFLAFRSD
jgi:hypothetical protein